MIVIEIDGFWWFVGALVICGLHGLYLRGWRRERCEYQQWRETYNVIEQKRHEEFMRVMGRDDASALGWNLDGGRKRGEA